jgi:hypothetical protein
MASTEMSFPKMPVKPHTKTVICSVIRLTFDLKREIIAYLGALISRYTPIAVKIRFGMNAAIRGGSPPFKANIIENRPITMYKKLRIIPIPSGRPTPPRTLRDETETPIRVRIKAESG